MPSGIKRTHNEFLIEFSRKNKHHDSIILKEKYIKNSQPILCKCLKCDHEWKPRPKDLLKGIGCPRCAGNIRISKREFFERLKEKAIIIKSKYSLAKGYISCECDICGNNWKTAAYTLL